MLVHDAPDAAFFNMTSAARYAGISRVTLWRLIEAGHIPVYTTPTGIRRIRKIDLDALYAKDDQ
uniref:Helix-turn-helix domain-containing protein n=1 Tax=Rhodococcus aetherivorans I24 TaxID=1036179 RepID=Q157F5_9NOCA|nr:helix-turn-helix domain-containing protein [Rhodococcus aetherivorans]ABG29058.1 hypothetical protein [Rhodococcus aetherivorans I24]